jgi:hypothetical protein
MHFLIPFMSLMAGVVAVENLFSFEDSSPIVDLDAETLSLDSNLELSSHELFTDEPPEGSLYAEDPGYGEEWLDEHTSPVYSGGVADACYLEPSAVSKKGRSRRSECKVQDLPEYRSPEFYDLFDLDIQQQVYKNFACPSSNPGEALVPVCSSSLPQNNFLEHTSYYTLLDSFLCTYLPLFGLLRDLTDSVKCSGTIWTTVLHPARGFAAKIGFLRRFSRKMVPLSQ